MVSGRAVLCTILGLCTELRVCLVYQGPGTLHGWWFGTREHPSMLAVCAVAMSWLERGVSSGSLGLCFHGEGKESWQQRYLALKVRAVELMHGKPYSHFLVQGRAQLRNITG